MKIRLRALRAISVDVYDLECKRITFGENIDIVFILENEYGTVITIEDPIVIHGNKSCIVIERKVGYPATTGSRYEEFKDAAHTLAMLCLQSSRYQDDPDYRQAVDNVLVHTMV